MSAPIIVFAFLLIVFAPCLVAYIAWSVGDTESSDEKFADRGTVLAPMGRLPIPLQAALPELPIGGDFKIRSFPKGLAQRRLVVRDMADGPRLKIGQVRAVAAELARLAGSIVAHDLALVAAALVAAGRSLATAAREAIQAAHNVLARQAWAGAGLAQAIDEAWNQGPPRAEPLKMATLWREESAAA